MHELSIAQYLIEEACTAASNQCGLSVQRIDIEIGDLVGVVREALEFSFTLAAAGTLCEGARLDVQRIPATAFCHTCHKAQPLRDSWHFVCPVCGDQLREIVTGQELDLVAVEIEIDQHVAANRRVADENPEKER